jgi:hypothetical protein
MTLLQHVQSRDRLLSGSDPRPHGSQDNMTAAAAAPAATAFSSFFASAVASMNDYIHMHHPGRAIHVDMRDVVSFCFAMIDCIVMARIVRKWTVQEQLYACEWGTAPWQNCPLHEHTHIRTNYSVRARTTVRGAFVGATRQSPIDHRPERYACPWMQVQTYDIRS